MSINRKSIVTFGIMILIGTVSIVWLVSLLSAFRLNQRQILFEVGFISPWTGSTAGFFIDAKGNVYTFSNDPPQNALLRFFGEAEKGEVPYTTSDLFKYYGNSSQLAGTIDTKTLNEMIGLIQPASTGVLSKDDPLTPTNCASFDAGIYTYRAYLYDSIHRTHTPVDLYTMGDIQEVNLSQEGRTLQEWLETTCSENDYFFGCKPSYQVCRP